MVYIVMYGLNYIDCIMIEDDVVVEWFLFEVDLVIVLYNVLIQFVDGGEFGMGVEIGIVMGWMYVCGFVGVEQLISFKYKVYGMGQICL